MEDKTQPIIRASDEVFLTPEQVREIEQECGLTSQSCIPRIVGHCIDVDDNGEFVREYDELNCDSCMEYECMWWLDSHTKEDKEQLELMLEEIEQEV